MNASSDTKVYRWPVLEAVGAWVALFLFPLFFFLLGYYRVKHMGREPDLVLFLPAAAYWLALLPLSYRSLGKLLVDKRGITYENIGFRKRIAFADVRRTVYRSRKQRLVLCGPRTRIVVTGKYHGFEELVAYVREHLSRDLPEGDSKVYADAAKEPLRCGYPAWMRWVVYAFACLLVASPVYISIAIVQQGTPAKDALPGAGIVTAVLAFFALKLIAQYRRHVWLTDKGLIQQTFFRRRFISFEEIWRAHWSHVPHIKGEFTIYLSCGAATLTQEPQLVGSGQNTPSISLTQDSITLSEKMQYVDEFMILLTSRRPGLWRSHVDFPVKIEVPRKDDVSRRQWLPSAMLAALAIFCIAVFLRATSSGETITVFLAGTAATAAIWLAWLFVPPADAKAVRRVVFHPSHFELESLKCIRRVSASAVKDIVLLKDSMLAHSKALVISLENEEFRIDSAFYCKTLEPLHDLLRESYLREAG